MTTIAIPTTFDVCLDHTKLSVFVPLKQENNNDHEQESTKMNPKPACKNAVKTTTPISGFVETVTYSSIALLAILVWTGTQKLSVAQSFNVGIMIYTNNSQIKRDVKAVLCLVSVTSFTLTPDFFLDTRISVLTLLVLMAYDIAIFICQHKQNMLAVSGATLLLFMSLSAIALSYAFMQASHGSALDVVMLLLLLFLSTPHVY